VAEYKDAMVFCEVSQGKLASITTELLGCGRKLADSLGEELSAVILGDGIIGLAREAITFGVDRVYIVDAPILKDYQTDPYVTVMEKVANQVKPRILLLGQTSIGRDLAPRLAFRLGTVATTDCIELTVETGSKNLLQTKTIYGGNIMATFISKFYPQIATVRAKVYSSLEPDTSRKGEIVTIDARLEPSAVRTRVIDKVSEKAKGVRLEDAAVIVAGGRGIGSADGFKELENLAKLLNGVVGATRPPCDNGWVHDSAQIGLTGKIVAPDLYLAIALSGSSQHISGFSGAKNIVAINKDPEANIYNVARFGIVGDWERVLPAFTAKIRELVSASSV
jgi:electron transfer flavoprotein alpha subunit